MCEFTATCNIHRHLDDVAALLSCLKTNATQTRNASKQHEIGKKKVYTSTLLLFVFAVVFVLVLVMKQGRGVRCIYFMFAYKNISAWHLDSCNHRVAPSHSHKITLSHTLKLKYLEIRNNTKTTRNNKKQQETARNNKKQQETTRNNKKQQQETEFLIT